MIVFFHFNFQGSGTIAGTWAVQKGWLFVDFFFVLSGFVLTHAYWSRIGYEVSPWRFLGLRLGRIYPLHLGVLAAMLVLEVALLVSNGSLASREAFAGDRSLEGLLASVLLLHSSNTTDGLVWNTPSWSIAAEFWAYVLFALIAVSGRMWLFAMAGAAALGMMLLTEPDLHYVTDRFGTARCVYGFSLGVLLCAWVDVPRLGRWTATLAETLMIAAVCGFTTYVWQGWPTLFGPPLFAITVLVFAGEGGLISRLLKTRPFLTLGLLSYSIYMVHPFVQARLMEGLAPLGWAVTGAPDRLTVGGEAADGLTLLMLAVVIAVAAMTYRWIERPVRDWSRRKLQSTNVEAAAPAF